MFYSSLYFLAGLGSTLNLASVSSMYVEQTTPINPKEYCLLFGEGSFILLQIRGITPAIISSLILFDTDQLVKKLPYIMI